MLNVPGNSCFDGRVHSQAGLPRVS
jgi:hypothetical protein